MGVWSVTASPRDAALHTHLAEACGEDENGLGRDGEEAALDEQGERHVPDVGIPAESLVRCGQGRLLARGPPRRRRSGRGP